MFWYSSRGEDILGDGGGARLCGDLVLLFCEVVTCFVNVT